MRIGQYTVFDANVAMIGRVHSWSIKIFGPVMRMVKSIKSPTQVVGLILMMRLVYRRYETSDRDYTRF